MIRRFLPFLLLSILLSSCLKDEQLKLSNTGFEPRTIQDDWLLSTPESEHMDRELLSQAFNLLYKDDRYVMARSLLVFRNNKLVAEAYPQDAEDIHRINNIQSCTKSITSILVGIAIEESKTDFLQERLYSLYPESFDDDASKRELILEDALTMRTGLEFDNGIHTPELYHTNKNSAAFVLSQRKQYEPGVVMHYNDGAPHLVSKAIEKLTGRALAEYAAGKLFTPLNIRDWKWEAAKDGTTFGAFSLFLKPRDLGKIGRILLQNGQWEGKQIINRSYLAEATSIKVSANFNAEPYGYYFWIQPAYGGYSALGHGGQFLLVVPEKELVVVYTAWPYTSKKFFDQQSELVDLIIKSCK